MPLYFPAFLHPVAAGRRLGRFSTGATLPTLPEELQINRLPDGLETNRVDNGQVA